MRGAVASTVGGAEYVATVRCVNPSPLAERRVSASDAHCPDTDALNRRSKPVFPMYTARATLEIGSGSVCSGRAVTTTTASNQVDSAIPFSCITSPEVVASCTTTASAQATVAVDPKPARGAAASTFNGMSLQRAGPHFTTAAVAQAAELEFKKMDENGNSVQGFTSPQSGSSQQKKQRRKKSSKNETVIKSHHIDGYQGNKDLNEVLRFIESNEPERPKRHDDKKKRSAERRKDKAPRASSLDDLSRAAPPPARPARPAQPAPKPERRSWGDERQPFYFRDPNPEPDPELTDFQTVTKKRKPRRRADEPSPRRGGAARRAGAGRGGVAAARHPAGGGARGAGGARPGRRDVRLRHRRAPAGARLRLRPAGARGRARRPARAALPPARAARAAGAAAADRRLRGRGVGGRGPVRQRQSALLQRVSVARAAQCRAVPRSAAQCRAVPRSDSLLAVQ